MATGDAAKSQVLNFLANGNAIQNLGKAKVRIGARSVHVRYRSNPKSGGVVWSFNANPNTLTADYELWICGSAEHYYLIPIAEIKEIYEDPAAYPDHRHPEIRVLEVDQGTHRCRYGSNRQKDFAPYFRARF
jgi:hypothetical protein